MNIEKYEEFWYSDSQESTKRSTLHLIKIYEFDNAVQKESNARIVYTDTV